ncbi:MAG TPA: hypothetical protein VGJ84_05370 [Polyangiaceae bacterium]|jgi:RNA recognition motif-containing protein
MAPEDARKLFVAGLPESITEEVLRQLFEAVGATVQSVSLPRDRTTGRRRGFGFVTLASVEEATQARQSLDGSVHSGRSISVRPFSSDAPRRGEARTDHSAGSGEDRTVYVGNLPYDVTQQELDQVFADNGVGPVVRIHLPVGPDGRMRGFGFVTMASAEASNSAIVSLRNVEVRGRRLLVKMAHPRGAQSEPRSAERAPRRRNGPADGSPPPEFPVSGPPEFVESARPVEGRRARPGIDAKHKKKKRGERTAETAPKRGRSGKKWDDEWDKDDWEEE